jgi:hypothetical protein
MYVVAQFLNVLRPQKKLGHGHLIAFDYAKAGTNPSKYNTLIKGEVFAGRDDSDTNSTPDYKKPETVSIWHKPVSVVYRGTDHLDGRETIIVSSCWDNGPMPQMEFYLDCKDSDGNLVRRGHYYTRWRIWNGQLDRLTGKIWFAPLYGYRAPRDGGLVCFDKDDFAKVTKVGAGAGYSDVASPGVADMRKGVIPRNGSRIVSANPRFNDLDPKRAGFEDYPKIHALSYHVHNVTQAHKCLKQGKRFNKPVIISDDAKEASIAAANDADEHYEHFDIHLGNEGRAHYGAFITGPDNFPSESKEILTVLGNNASQLAPGGRLTCAGSEFYWDGKQVTLMGSSWMGALVAKNCDVDGYFDALAGFGVNLTRVWCIEQWSGVAFGEKGFERYSWVPFEGHPGAWDLTVMNQQYFGRVVEFVRKAASRGIVVQLTLFDRCGLPNKPGRGQWRDSPYNIANNVNDFLAPKGRYAEFTGMEGTRIGEVNQRFTERVVGELRGYGNVIYEIMNEPHHNWKNQGPWHRWVTDIIHQSFDKKP